MKENTPARVVDIYMISSIFPNNRFSLNILRILMTRIKRVKPINL